MDPIDEIIWTSGATNDLLILYAGLEDYQAGAGDRFHEVLDPSLTILRTFPFQAPPAVGFPNLRRLLFGNSHRFGLYYSVVGRRIIINALLDLRMSPESIRKRLSEDWP